MWSQSYLPLGGLVPSALLAAVPVVLMLYLLGVARKPSWVAGLSGCAVAFVIAVGAYRMPVNLAVNSAIYGAAYGLLPIGWIVFTALLLYRLAVETGKWDRLAGAIARILRPSGQEGRS